MNSARFAFLIAMLLAPAAPVSAVEIESVPVEVIFATSSGYWEEPAVDVAANATLKKGYYKLIALRQPDRTAMLYLQQIAVTEAGLEIVQSSALEEFTALKPYVSDIRPETSDGTRSQPGFFATVTFRTDPAARETESWTVLIDDLGEIRVERASN